MALYARIENDIETAQREFSDVTAIPAHKMAAWRIVEDPGAPAFNAALETCTKENVIEPARILVKWTVARRPLADQVAAVKAEAQRRIIAITGKTTLQDCMIKQFNALMRAGELTDRRVSGEVLTPEENVEAEVLRNLAAKVKAIRAASNAIETMEPIPLDFSADKYWL